MRGPDGLGHVVTAIFRAPLWQVVGEHRYGVYSVNHPRGRGHLPAVRPRRPLALRDLGRRRTTSRATRRERFARRIRPAPASTTCDVSIERTGSFSFAAQLADRFRAGNVFLAGDAAHRVTPRGGTGMNTAIAGGHDLGWKLGWVLRGWAGPELLDTYEAERRPIAAHNVARSADPDGSTREAADELHVDLGGRIAHVWVRTDAGRVSTLDLLDPGLTLFTGPDRRRVRGGAAGRRPAGHRPSPGRRQRALDRHPRSRWAARAPRRHAGAAVDAGRDCRRLRGARRITHTAQLLLEHGPDHARGHRPHRKRRARAPSRAPRRLPATLRPAGDDRAARAGDEHSRPRGASGSGTPGAREATGRPHRRRRARRDRHGPRGRVGGPRPGAGAERAGQVLLVPAAASDHRVHGLDGVGDAATDVETGPRMHA